jgi:outer membrane protein OmpA-like peptidoglycan-associated protein
MRIDDHNHQRNTTMSGMTRNIRRLGIWCGPLILAAGCATVAPPPELVAARSEYAKAAAGPAAQLNLVGLNAAKNSLDSANKAFERDPKSQYVRDTAYIAMRKAELAEAQARIVANTAQIDKAGKDKATANEGALADAKAKLATSEQQRRETATDLSRSDDARQRAEKQSDEATANLAELALAKANDRAEVITLSGGVLFASGQSTLLPTARPKLDDVARALQKSNGSDFVVEGHTDSRGSDSMNQDLSTRRAESVRSYLVERGVSSGQIKAVGFGKTRPLTENGTAEGRANNRRVEIVVHHASS